MKKLFAILAFLVLISLLCACGSEKVTEGSESGSVTELPAGTDTEDADPVDKPEPYEFSPDDPEVDEDLLYALTKLDISLAGSSFWEGLVVPADRFLNYFEIFEIGPIDGIIGEEYEKYITTGHNIRLPKEIYKSVIEKRFAVTVDLEGSSRLTEDGEYLELKRQVRDQTPKCVVKEITENDGEISVVCDAVYPQYEGSFDRAAYYTYGHSFMASLRFDGEDYVYLSYSPYVDYSYAENFKCSCSYNDATFEIENGEAKEIYAYLRAQLKNAEKTLTFDYGTDPVSMYFTSEDPDYSPDVFFYEMSFVIYYGYFGIYDNDFMYLSAMPETSYAEYYRMPEGTYDTIVEMITR